MSALTHLVYKKRITASDGTFIVVLLPF